MAQIAEQDTAPETTEATVNYLLETSETPFTFTGGPGSTELRSGGTQDPRRVVIRNGRYMLPNKPGYSIEMYPESLERYAFPEGEAWSTDHAEASLNNHQDRLVR